jgi:hypothetical protein
MIVRSLCILACLLAACTRDDPAAVGAKPAAGAGAPAAGVAGVVGGTGASTAGADAPEAGAGPAEAGSGGVAAMGDRSDCLPSFEGLAVAGADRVGYPPYAAHGCRLLYVANDGTLRLRGSDGTSDEMIAPAEERPQRPTIAGDILAWESARDERVRIRFGGEVRDLRGVYERSGQPRATEDAVVFTGWNGEDADILVYEPASDRMRVVASGPGQQLFADISATQIAYSDFSEDPDGAFDEDGKDLSDIVLVDRTSLEQRRMRLPGKQAFPLLRANGDVVYLQWAESHPEPKLSQYIIMAWESRLDARVELARVETQPPYVRPSVAGNTVEWVERPSGVDERMMRVQESNQPPEIAFSRRGVQLFATASSAMATLLATQNEAEPIPRLRAIAR